MQHILDPRISISALGSLCREAQGLRLRLVRIDEDQERCQTRALCLRLQRESEHLLSRLAELGRIATWLQSAPVAVDELSLALFQELCWRPLPRR
ncbi:MULTISPECIES: hypothetical protein [unclassified Synechococcus]|uniref:hypothetical protein n=1 Tax=unclassified Synechococcus TaxID=2626047 RepID=UPI002000765D|nr:hypothetical protein [Synechococcus sp. A10-1-5-1]UPM50115.1 hypothetical protein MY494_12540 [Synechococcus sp. A10-1-5-1]